MNAAYINAFINATRETIDTMVHVPVAFGKARLRAADERPHKFFKVSVVIGLSGNVTGHVVLNLSEPAALALASGLAGIILREMNDESFDALGEIANMISGAARRTMAGVTVTVPAVKLTRDVVYRTDLPAIALPFDTPVGRFQLDVQMRDLTPPPQAAA